MNKVFSKLYIVLLAGVALTFAACEEDENILKYRDAPSLITTPEHPAFSASFSELDDIRIPVSAVGASELSVSGAITTTTGVVQRDYGTVPLTNGEGVFQATWDQILGNDVFSAVRSIELYFTANVNGESTFRDFALRLTNPVTFVLPATGFNDSTVLASLTITNFETGLQDVQIFTKIGKNAAYSATPDRTIDLAGEKSYENKKLAFNIPSEENLVIGRDTLFVQVRTTAANGRTFTKNATFRPVGVPLDVEGTVTLRPDDYVVAMDGTREVADSLNYGFFFAQETMLADSAVAGAGADTTDIRLVYNQLLEELSLTSGADSDTRFIRADQNFDYAAATYQTARDAFMASQPQASVSIERQASSQVYIARLGMVEENAFPASDNRRYVIFRVTNVDRGFDLKNSEVTIEYKIRRL